MATGSVERELVPPGEGTPGKRFPVTEASSGSGNRGGSRSTSRGVPGAKRRWPRLGFLQRRVPSAGIPDSSLENALQAARERMVQDQLVQRGIRDARVLAAMRTVPRHLFVPEEDRSLAYEDMPLPIGHGQTISQPYIVGLMTELLRLRGREKVLEVGTGSGYQAALLSLLARHVFTVERHEALSQQARETLEHLGLGNVTVLLGDGSRGLPQQAPFDAILVTASPPAVPPPLLGQLAPGGRLVLPTGPSGGQRLELWTRRGASWDREDVLPVAFVPLIGQYGWKDDRSR